MKFPATLQELESAGYVHVPDANKQCSCGIALVWFKTPKKADGSGKWMPFSATADSQLMPHHAVCRNVKDFRAANKKHEDRTRPAPPKQKDFKFT